MLFTSHENLEDSIVRHLIDVEHTAEDIRQLLAKDLQKYSVQSVYAALRILLAAEVVAKRGTLYYLNQEWRTKIVSRLQTHTRLDLEDGESVVYSLSSLANSDLQWKNIVLPLHQEKPKDPIFFYNYHYIWPYLSDQRKKSEFEYFADILKNKTYAFCLIGGELPQDREFKHLMQNEFIQVAIGKKIFSERQHITLFGDYIITTTFSPSLAKEIDEHYDQSRTTAELEPLLHILNTENKRIRLTIERNQQKAKKIRKRFSTEFFIPPAIREILS